MKKFINWLGRWLPYAWTMMWVVIITAVSFGAMLLASNWVIDLLGVL
jgi:hypothetical protein